MFGLSLRDRFDPNAQAYIDAVEAADGQFLETEVKVAITRFVKGCKDDGNWNALKASCLLCGARTLAGALVPLVGTAPTNFNFVSGDYNRKTGLKGNGIDKYLNSNRNNTSDPQNNHHISCYRSDTVIPAKSVNGTPIGATIQHNGNPAGTHIGWNNSRSYWFSRSSTSVATSPAFPPQSNQIGLVGLSRNNSSNYNMRFNAQTVLVNTDSEQIPTAPIRLYLRDIFSVYWPGSLGFYSIGESLDLVKLDARVTTLMSAFNRYIPN